MVSLGIMFECSVTLTVIFFSQIQMEFPMFSFDPVSPCTVTHWTPLKRIWPHPLDPPLIYLFASIIFPLRFLQDNPALLL